VLIAGGVNPATGSSGGKLLDLFDPTAQQFRPAGEMSTSRSELTATEFIGRVPPASSGHGSS
jgi:hypothetical protein